MHLNQKYINNIYSLWHWYPCFPKPHRKFLQKAQNVGCRKNFATNLCPFTSWTLKTTIKISSASTLIFQVNTCSISSIPLMFYGTASSCDKLPSQDIVFWIPVIRRGSPQKWSGGIRANWRTLRRWPWNRILWPWNTSFHLEHIKKF